MRIRSRRWLVVPTLVAAATLLLAHSPATATTPAKAKKSCKLLTPAEITSVFQREAGAGTQKGSDCTWQVGDLALSLDLTTKDAKSTFEALRDLAKNAGAQPRKVTGVRDKAVYAEIQSFKELLVLKGKKFLFLRLLDIASPIDSETAKAALTDLGKKAVKRV
jgi:hypothetical protein